MIKIIQDIDPTRCYFCRQTEAQVNEQLNLNGIQAAIKESIQKRKEDHRIALQSTRKSIFNLIRECAGYPKSLTVEEIGEKLTEYRSLMPRIDEFIRLKHLGVAEEGTLSTWKLPKLNRRTVEEILFQLQILYDELLENRFSELLKQYDEAVYYKLTKDAVDPEIGTGDYYIPESFRFSSMLVVIYTDLTGTHLRKAIDRHYYYEYEFNGDRLRENSVPVEKSNVVEIALRIPVCGICRNFNTILHGRAI